MPQRPRNIADTKLYDKDYSYDPAFDIHILDGKNSSVDLKNFNPVKVGQKAIVICSDSTNDCTITADSDVTFDGTNDVATFADAGDALYLIAMSMTRWLIMVNVGSVSFS